MNKKIVDHQYSDSVYHQKIAILGMQSPPLGGVSVHIMRVIKKFERQHNNVKLFQTTREYRYRFFFIYIVRLFFFLLLFRPQRLYFHTLYLTHGLQELRFINILKKIFKYHITVIDHDCRFLYKHSLRYKKKLSSIIMTIDHLVMIGNLTYQSYHDNQIQLPFSYTIESAFLAPDLLQEQKIIASYPPSLFDFITEHSPKLLVNAFQLSLLQGHDLYGFDLCIETVRILKKRHKNIGIIFVLAQIGDEYHFHKLQKSIVHYNLKTNCYFLIGQKELWPLFKYVDLFIRPTLSDGASVSVAEALYMKVPVIASDVCLRPDGVILFKTGDRKNLLKAVDNMLKRECYEIYNQQRYNMHQK